MSYKTNIDVKKWVLVIFLHFDGVNVKSKLN